MNEQLSETIKILSSINHSLLPRPFYLDWSFWNVVIIFITLIFLACYTIYTRKILEENKKIRQSEFMPFLYVRGNDFRLAEQPNCASFIGNVSFLNIGKGPAINVTIDNIEIGYRKIFFKSLPLAPQKENYSLVHDSFEKIDPRQIEPLKEPTKNQSKFLKIRCKDQLGNRYLFKYDISNLDKNPKYVGYSLLS